MLSWRSSSCPSCASGLGGPGRWSPVCSSRAAPGAVRGRWPWRDRGRRAFIAELLASWCPQATRRRARARRTDESAKEYGLNMATVTDTRAAVPHLSVAERVARGKAARAEVPRSSHAGFQAAPHRPDPVELLERQAASRVPELVPIRYGRMLVSPFSVLPRRRADHGQRPRGDAALGPDGAVLRRRAPVELRRVRLARAPAGVRPQRLRRDAAGPVGVGRQAPGGEHVDRGTGQRLRGQGPGPDRARHRRGIPHGDGRASRR